MSAQIVRDIAKEAFSDAIEMLAIIETLEASNSAAAHATVSSAQTVEVAMYVRAALWSRLLSILIRAYAAPRSGDRHAQYAFDLLKDPVVTAAVVAAGGDFSTLNAASALWAKCRGDHRLPGIKDFRDKQIAHSGTQKLPSPIINSIFDVTRATADALERLAQGTGIITLSVASQLVNYRAKADRFWT